MAAYEEKHNVGHISARQALVRLDRIRDEFISRSFHRSVHDPAAHDLCVNLDSLSVETATEIILRGLEVRFPHAKLHAV